MPEKYRDRLLRAAYRVREGAQDDGSLAFLAEVDAVLEAVEADAMRQPAKLDQARPGTDDLTAAVARLRRDARNTIGVVSCRADIETVCAALEQTQQAALEIMVVLGPVVADAAIVGQSYGWTEVLAMVRQAKQENAKAQQQLARIKVLARSEHDLLMSIVKHLQDIGEIGENYNLTGAIHGVIDGCVNWRATAKQAQQEITNLEAWKDAVIDAAVVDWVYKKEHETNPRQCVNDLLVWQSIVALDPAVSEEARKLHAQIAEAQEEIARLTEQLRFANIDVVDETVRTNDAEALARTLARALDGAEFQHIDGFTWWRTARRHRKKLGRRVDSRVVLPATVVLDLLASPGVQALIKE